MDDIRWVERFASSRSSNITVGTDLIPLDKKLSKNVLIYRFTVIDLDYNKTLKMPSNSQCYFILCAYLIIINTLTSGQQPPVDYIINMNYYY